MFMPPVFPAHWHVSQPVLIADTFSSLVWKVSLPDGTPAIVKGLKPIEDIADELRGADYLDISGVNVTFCITIISFESFSLIF